MESNLRSVLHESTVINPDAYARFLSTLQSSQLQVPFHSSSNAHSMAFEDGEVYSRQINQFPMELGRTMNDQPHEDNVAQQPVPSTSSTNVNLDALSRQIMMAGMAALGMNNPALQQQLVLGESNTSSVNPFFNFNNVSVPVTMGSSVQSSVPDGSGLLRYRAPEIDSFVYDRNTGYRFDPASGLHYDANTGVFINVGQKIFMRWDPISNTYLREGKRSGPFQSVVPMSSALPTMRLDNHSNTQAIPVTVYSADMIQTLNATSADALLRPSSVVNQAGRSGQDGNVILPIPAGEHISQEEAHLKALWQQMIYFEKEVENSKTNQVPEVVCRNKFKDENECIEPKKISRTRSPSKKSSDPTDSHRVRRRSRSRSKSSKKRAKGGHRRSRSTSRSRSRSDSQIRKRSRSRSQEARSTKRSRRSHSREGRRQKSRETRRSRSRGRRRSYSRSPVHHSRRHRSRSVTPQKSNENSEAKKHAVYSSVTEQKASGSGLGSNCSDLYSREANFERTNKKGFIHPSQKGFKEKPVCFKCGIKGHCENDCNIDGKLCYNCHKISDHVAVDCPMPRKANIPNTNKRNIEAAAPSADSASTSKTAIKTPQKSSAPGEKGKPTVCYKCGADGHTMNNCGVEGFYCYGCLKIADHKAAMCPLRIARGRGLTAGAKGDVDDNKLPLTN